jgi:hypothetical protein
MMRFALVSGYLAPHVGGAEKTGSESATEPLERTTP